MTWEPVRGPAMREIIEAENRARQKADAYKELVEKAKASEPKRRPAP